MAQILSLVGAFTAGNPGAPSVLSSATLTVPANQYWLPHSTHLKYNSCGVVGNRQMRVLWKRGTTPYGHTVWLPAQAASVTRYYSAWEGASASAAFVATSYAQTAMARGVLLPPAMTIAVDDWAAIVDATTRTSFAVGTISSVDATTVVATSAIFGGVDDWKGFTLTMGASTAVITTNDGTTLTFAAWVGGTPAPAAYYLEGDTCELEIAYDLYQVMMV